MTYARPLFSVLLATAAIYFGILSAATAAPVITSIALPGGNAPTTGGITGTITGSDFGLAGDTAFLEIGGNSANIVSRTATQIQFELPAYTGGNRTVDAQVTINAGQSNTQSFQYNAPSITQIVAPSPSLGGGSPFTINGADFGTDIGSLSVTVGGQAATLTLANHAQLQAILPAYTGGGATQQVVVTSIVDGLSSNAGDVTYTATPTITAVSGAAGPTLGGNTFSIFGTEFDPSTGLFVTVDGEQALVISQSLTEIVVAAPPGSGQDLPIVVGSTTFGTQSTEPFFYNYETQVAVSEPATALILGVTLAGLGFARFRQRRAAAS